MKTFLKTYATPISIIVAGALVGVGIITSKLVTQPQGIVPKENPQTREDIVASITETSLVKKLGIKEKDLATCIAENETMERVDRDIELGQKAGLKGTPHMIVIKKTDAGEIQFPLFGALPKEMILQAIEAGKTPTEQANYVQKFEQQILTDDDHITGDRNASVIIVEYSDIDCPFCKRLHPTLQNLVDEGKIAWVFRHSPIPDLHPFAYTKAVATECVAQLKGEDAFWEYLNELAQ